MLRQFSGPATMVCIGGGEIATQLRRTVELISIIFRCVRIAERTFSPAAFLRWLGVASDARFCADTVAKVFFHRPIQFFRAVGATIE
jgi:hypothetical protein